MSVSQWIFFAASRPWWLMMFITELHIHVNIMAAATWASCWTSFQTHAQTLVFFSLQHVCTLHLINHCHRCLWQLRHREVRDSGSPLHLHLLAQNKNIPHIWFIVSQQHVLNPQPRLCFLSPQLASFFYRLFLPQTPSAGKVLGCI